MQNHIFKKGLVLLTLGLFLGVSFGSSISTNVSLLSRGTSSGHL